MPLFDFECPQCNNEVEYLISFSQYEKQEYETKCQACEVEPDKMVTLERVISPLNFRLMGSRWHRDGYVSQIDHEHNAALKEHDTHQRNADKYNTQSQNLEAF